VITRLLDPTREDEWKFFERHFEASDNPTTYYENMNHWSQYLGRKITGLDVVILMEHELKKGRKVCISQRIDKFIKACETQELEKVEESFEEVLSFVPGRFVTQEEKIKYLCDTFPSKKALFYKKISFYFCKNHCFFVAFCMAIHKEKLDVVEWLLDKVKICYKDFDPFEKYQLVRSLLVSSKIKSLNWLIRKVKINDFISDKKLIKWAYYAHIFYKKFDSLDWILHRIPPHKVVNYHDKIEIEQDLCYNKKGTRRALEEWLETHETTNKKQKKFAFYCG
jgi:hypothetical protein